MTTSEALNNLIKKDLLHDATGVFDSKAKAPVTPAPKPQASKPRVSTGQRPVSEVASRPWMPQPKDGEYIPKKHEEVITHIKIIKSGKVTSLFGDSKEAFAIFFGNRFIGRIERPHGNIQWTAIIKGKAISQTKSITKAIFNLIEQDLEDTFKGEIRVVAEKPQKEE